MHVKVSYQTPQRINGLLAEDSSTLHQSQIMNHRLERRRATQVIRVATKANALHQCHRSFPRCSSNMQPGSADFPLLLSITRHQPFSSQTIDTQQGEMHLLRARVYLWAIHIWWRGTGHHWHAALETSKMINPFKCRDQCETITLKKAVSLFLYLFVKSAKWKPEPCAKNR